MHFKDFIKIFLLCIFIWGFTQFFRSYTLFETVGMMIFVVMIYFLTSFLTKKNKAMSS